MSNDTIQAAIDSQAARNQDPTLPATMHRPAKLPWQIGSANTRKLPPKPDLELAIRKGIVLAPQTPKAAFL
jgi:hypothetical protein